jgi:uncharacterized protein
MNLYKLNRILHRDLGYFYVGLILIYSISGIAVNHRKDWNPNYSIINKEFKFDKPVSRINVDTRLINEILSKIGEETNYKNHYFPKDSILTIFIDGGNVKVNINTGICIQETIRRRPILYEINFLHYNPGVLWTWFSDIFCVMLIFLAISGLFIIKGKNGLKWRGTIFCILGIVVPILFLMYYLL